MGISVVWYDNEPLCAVYVPRVVEWADLQAYDASVIHHLNRRNETVHFIVDLSLVQAIPSMRQIATLAHARHPHIGRVLTVGLAQNVKGRSVFAMGVRLLGLRYYDFNTFEDARTHLLQSEGV